MLKICLKGCVYVGEARLLAAKGALSKRVETEGVTLRDKRGTLTVFHTRVYPNKNPSCTIASR